MHSTDQIRSEFSRWIEENPRQAIELFSTFVGDASDRRILEIVGMGRELGHLGLPAIEDCIPPSARLSTTFSVMEKSL